MTTTQRPKFTAMHYNAIAKEIREVFPTMWADSDPEPTMSMARQQKHLAQVERATLTNFALNLAKRFKEDNPNFDPHRFLDACSPNTDLYPLSELWEA